MKELDLLLERFIEENLNSLEEGSWPELEAILQTEDDVLWDWLQDPCGNADPAHHALLLLIRDGRS